VAASAQSPLEYAPVLPRQRQRTRRWVLAVAAAIFVVSGYFWVPIVRDRLMLLHFQRQCMNYTAPATQVIFTNDLFDLANVSPRSDYSIWSDGSALLKTAQITHSWDRFAGGLSRLFTLAFCHRLQSPAGHDRIVFVTFTPPPPAGLGYAVGFDSEVFVPGSLFAAPEFRLTGSTLSVVRPHGTFTIYAGQIDPADPSHFTIIYRHGNQDSVIDGWLNDDDTVSMQERKSGSPLARPFIPPAPTSQGSSH